MEKYMKGVLQGLFIGICGTILFRPSYREIPSQSKVQSGYIAPIKLEIVCEDLDRNGELETIMRIGDKQYLLREVDGRPVISAYEIKPAQIAPKEK